MPVDGELHKASHKGDLEELERLLGQAPVPNSDNEADIAGATPGLATPETTPEDSAGVDEDGDREDIVKVDDMGANNRTALQRACGAGHVACVEFLLRHGADVNHRDGAKRSALHWACIAGHTEVVATLMNFPGVHVDFTAATESGATALHMAVAAKKPDLIPLLVTRCRAAAAVVSGTDGLEDTEEATMARLDAMFKAVNKDGQTAWDMAVTAKDKVG